MVRVDSGDPYPAASRGRSIATLVGCMVAVALSVPAVGLAAASPRLSTSFRIAEARLSIHGTLRQRRGARRLAFARWRVLLEEQVRNAGTDRSTWATRAHTKLERRGRSGRFSFAWTAPASTQTLVVRVVVASGRRTLAVSDVKRFVVRRPSQPAPTTTSPTQPSPTPAPCGGEELPPKPGGGTWTCTFDDEFDASTGDSTALNPSWWVPQVTATSAYTTGPIGDEACYVDSTNNISVSGGALHLTARNQGAPFTCGYFTTQYTAGMVSTYARFNQTYGRFEVRAQLPQTTATGLQETLWLWPVNDTLYGPWPDSGEIDFSEFYSEYSTLDVPYIHYNYGAATVNPTTDTNTVTATNCQITLSQYNDYAVVWTPGSMTITVNGNLCLIDNYLPDDGLASPAPFNQPFFIALTQALGINTNAFNPGATPLPATTSIDYVRVWK